MPVFNNVLAGAAGSGGAAADYRIDRSLRFNSSDNAYISRSQNTEPDRDHWTYSVWVKRNKLGTEQTLLRVNNGGTDTNNMSTIDFRSDDKLQYYVVNGGNLVVNKITERVFKDVFAWYHIVISLDMPVLQIWVNGVRIGSSELSTNSPNSSSYVSWIGRAETMLIGRNTTNGSVYGDFTLADPHFLEGTAVTNPNDFGQFDSNGVWNPKEFTGSFGTNGWHLDFSDTSTNTAVGADSSGNNNHFDLHSILGAGTTFTQTSVASATGGLPILNTTDTYGNAMGSGDRADPLASNLQWAVPLGHNGSRDFYDKAITNRTSGVRHISGNPGSHSTSISNFYGGSLYMSGGATGSFSTDVWNSISAANSQFTFEFWIYLDSTTMSNGYGATLFSSRPAGDNGAGWFDIGFGGITGNKPRMRLQVSQGWDFKFNFDGSNNDAPFPSGEWIHVAVTRDSNNKVRLFGNGILLQTQTSNVGITNNNRGLFGGHSYGAFASYVNYYLQDVRVYNTCKYTSSFNPPRETTTTLNAQEVDSLLDSPTNYETDSGVIGGNYCTLNPLDRSQNEPVFSNGNLQMQRSGNYATALSSFGMTSGKWYCEFIKTGTGTNTVVGIHDSTEITDYLDRTDRGYGWRSDGNKVHNNQAHGNIGGYSEGDVMGLAFDANAKAIYFYKNGSLSGSFTGVTPTDATHYFAFSAYGGVTIKVNFGQQGFKFPPPSGYKALCSTNLTDQQIDKPSDHFLAKAYTGNGGTQTISTDFSPDLVWLKSRNSGDHHGLWDTFRGALIRLTPDHHQTQSSRANTLTSFNSNGFTLGSAGEYNGSGGKVAWVWEGGDLATNSTYNQSEVWSSKLSTYINSFGSEPVTNLFDGSTSTSFYSNSASGSGIKFVPTTAITGSIELYLRNGDTANSTFSYSLDNGSTFTNLTTTAGNGSYVSIGNQTISNTNGIIVRHVTTAGTNSVNWRAIKVDNKVLVDEGLIPVGSLNNDAYDDSQNWSGLLSASGGSGFSNQGNGAFAGYDTNQDYTYVTGANSGTNYIITFTPTSTVNFTDAVVVRVESTHGEASIDGGSTWVAESPPNSGVVTFNGPGSFSNIKVRDNRGQYSGEFHSIRIDGKLLVNTGTTPPSVPMMPAQVRANPTAGFSIVKYKGNSSITQSLPHGLNAAPEFIFGKNVNNSLNWAVYTKTTSPAGWMKLNTGNNYQGSTGVWGNKYPDSTVFYVGNDGEMNQSGQDHLAYCFTPVPGFSAMGRYDGRAGHHTRPVIYTGFRPAFVMIKSYSHSTEWYLFDTARSPDNYVMERLYANEASQENDQDIHINIHSLGFEVRSTLTGLNTSGVDYVYLAFAENPFKTARAR